MLSMLCAHQTFIKLHDDTHSPLYLCVCFECKSRICSQTYKLTHSVELMRILMCVYDRITRLCVCSDLWG